MGFLFYNTRELTDFCPTVRLYSKLSPARVFDKIMIHLTFSIVTALPLTKAHGNKDEDQEEDDQHPRKLLKITKPAFSLSS